MQPRVDLRIRVLGGLDVRRRDGSLVEHKDWRTGMTMDLLCILALSSSRSVRVSSVTQRLWPDVDSRRARASLRTASSQVRRATGTNCVVREGDFIELVGAWVDAGLFLNDAKRVLTLADAGRHRRAVDLTRAAERLYLDDFHAHDDESSWAQAEREHLRQSRKAMLRRAAESAIELRDFRLAADFAETAVRVDPTAEAAYRALMRSYAELGEIGRALRAFEGLRAHLADELGADPSVQTRDLHLSLLRGGVA